MKDLIDAAPNNQSQTPTSLLSDQPTWSWQDTMRGALLTLVPWLAIALLSFFFPPGSQAPPHRLPHAADLTSAVFTFILQALLEGAFLIAPLWYAVFKPGRLARQRGLPTPSLQAGLRGLGFRSFRPWQVLGAAVGGMVVIYLVGILYTLIAEILHFSVQTNVDTVLKDAEAAPYTAVAILIAAVVVAPFCEEIFFRSFLFQGLRARLNVWFAIALSTLLWGLGHGDLGSLALLIAIGVILAFLRWRARSIWPGIALHMLNNAVSAVIVIQAIHF